MNKNGYLDSTIYSAKGIIENIGEISLISCPTKTLKSLSECNIATKGQANAIYNDASQTIITEIKSNSDFIYRPVSSFRQGHSDNSSIGPDIIFGNQKEFEYKYISENIKFSKSAPAYAAERERASKMALESDANRRKTESANNIKIKKEIVFKSAIGTMLFCDSSKNILAKPGDNLTDIPFYCNLDSKKNDFWVGELLNNGWEVTSEVRIPQETTLGNTGYIISLSLKRVRINN